MPTTFEGITIDHKIPRAQFKRYTGNVNNTLNLELICPSCNSMKGQRTLKEFLEYLNDLNHSILETRTRNHNPGDIVAPLFPAIGLGISRFGPDQSAALFITGTHGKNKAPDTRPIHPREVGGRDVPNHVIPIVVKEVPRENRPRAPIPKRRRNKTQSNKEINGTTGTHTNQISGQN